MANAPFKRGDIVRNYYDDSIGVIYATQAPNYDEWVVAVTWVSYSHGKTLYRLHHSDYDEAMNPSHLELLMGTSDD